RALFKIKSSSPFKTVYAGVKFNNIEVNFKDFFLLKFALHIERNEKFARLANKTALHRQEEILHHLLRNGAGPAQALAIFQGVFNRSFELIDVDPIVLKESPVFTYEKGTPNTLRNLRKSDPAF